jgi:hypothetical protein
VSGPDEGGKESHGQRHRKPRHLTENRKSLDLEGFAPTDQGFSISKVRDKMSMLSTVGQASARKESSMEKKQVTAYSNVG